LLAACQPSAGQDSSSQSAETNPQADIMDDTAVLEDSAKDGSAPLPAPLTLTEQWKATGFNSPEGVVAAPGEGYFISNVAGDGSEKDGAGWISKLSWDGEMIEKEFATGMNAPKGMLIERGVLYVADIDSVHRFDPSGTLLNTIEIDGAESLNDMTSWKSRLLVSDSSGGRIWQINDDGASVWLEGERLAGVNGLVSDGDRLLVATMESGSLYEVNEAGELNEIATGMKNADGIGRIDNGYLVSSWPGQIWFVNEDGETQEVLNTEDEGILQNDLTVIGGTVIVPNWLPGTVTAWSVEAAE
jgi:hypothetical protein